MMSGLVSRVKSALLILTAVFLILAGAYTYGNSAAKRAQEEKKQREENKRLRRTVEVLNEATTEIRGKNASAVRRELRDKWMRD